MKKENKLIEIRDPDTDYRSVCSINDLKKRKSIIFKDGKIINFSGGICNLLKEEHEDLGYNRKESINFEKRYEQNKVLRDTLQFSFFQDLVIGEELESPILSVACGTMYWDSKLKFNSAFVPIDVSEHMLRIGIARKRFNFGIRASGTDLPFSDNQFSISYCIDGLPENFYTGNSSSNIRKKMLREMHRVTVRGGKIALLLPNRNSTIFSNLIKFKKLRGQKYDEYGFKPSEIKKEIRDLGYEITHFSFQRNMTPFKSKKFLRFWDALINVTKINFLGYIFIIIKA